MSFYITIYLETPQNTDLDLNQENLKISFGWPGILRHLTLRVVLLDADLWVPSLSPTFLKPNKSRIEALSLI